MLLKFVIVNVESKPILGLHACKMLDLIKIIHQTDILSKSKILTQYNHVFQGLGNFLSQPYHIEINENVNPVVNPPWRVPQLILMNLKSTLSELEEKGGSKAGQ